MPTKISPLSEVNTRANLGDNVEIGPFCVVGPDVTIGDGTKLASHVAITGRTSIGEENRFYPNAVIGGEPQDISYSDTGTRLEIGNNNIFREGVTVNRGAEKEDGTTRIGNGNMLMANSHVAHNCHIFNNVILVNGVLLGGHVHVHDRAIISGNSVVHHFSTVGTLAFVSGGCRVPHDIPPFMLAAGSDNPTIKTVNTVGMRRQGISEKTINAVKQAHRLIFREHKAPDAVRETLYQEFAEVFPYELTMLLKFIEDQRQGKMGRAREAIRDVADSSSTDEAQNSTQKKEFLRRAA
ncbi:MAG: acyl-ACP--UDP-N-acetylglucosamine O-acyltransferase [Planctomycetes bacterium]|nr:acyl-ACP--UDP-N-acetylglucosamine O-acyltransferase [Planctomycetota bacterium]